MYICYVCIAHYVKFSSFVHRLRPLVTICGLSFVYSLGFVLVKFSLEKCYVLLNKESKYCLVFRLFKYLLFLDISYIYAHI